MTTTPAEDTLYGQLLAAFAERGTEGEPVKMSEIRHRAFERFRAVGFPTVKNEEWKYTNLHRLVNRSYVPAGDDAADLSASDLAKAEIPGLDAHRVVLLNGRYLPNLSSSLADEPGVTVRSIADAQAEPNFEKHYARHADRSDNVLVQLNTALQTTGIYISIANNTLVSKPLHIVHVAAGADPFFAQVRNLVVAERLAEVEIIESYISLGSTAAYLHNGVSEIVLAENAKVRHYQVQIAGEAGNYLSHTEIHQSRGSLYNHYNCILPGAAFVRNNINVRLDGENVEAHLYGINLTAGTQFVDNHTVVDHLKPHCESYEWYKNIPREASTAVFNGKIFVREGAQKTNAFQQNNNMLIGEKATVHSKPQLEIFADDVKCSHGCTMGQFDDDALFYLRSRGIGEEAARALLVHAFAFDVTSRIASGPVRAYVEGLVGKGLG